MTITMWTRCPDCTAGLIAGVDCDSCDGTGLIRDPDWGPRRGRCRLIQPGSVWLTIPDAARLVDRSEATIRRWIREHRMRCYLGMVDEHAVLTTDRDTRRARNTPRGIIRTNGAGQHANGLRSPQSRELHPHDSREADMPDHQDAQ